MASIPTYDHLLNYAKSSLTLRLLLCSDKYSPARSPQMGFQGQCEELAWSQLDSCQHHCAPTVPGRSGSRQKLLSDCGSRGRTLLSCPCSICHLLVAIYTALIAGVGWAGGNGNVWEPPRHRAEKRKILLGSNVPDWAWEGVTATCHSTGTALQARRLCRPTAFQRHAESLKNPSLRREIANPSRTELQGFNSSMFYSACFSCALCCPLYVFNI